MDYQDFIKSKAQLGTFDGFKPVWIPDFLFDFQKSLVDWTIQKGKSANIADCGLGKTPMQLVWAENVVRKTNKNVLIITPLAVSYQTIREGAKFGIECKKSNNGKPKGKITVTNYEQLHHFNANDYIGVVCDESSILKNFDGTRKRIITEFLRLRPYRLLCTATAAPNDYIELGTTSEALGELGFMDMLNRYFKNDQNTSDTKKQWGGHSGVAIQWRFKRHAQQAFWQWVCSWARIIRKPSDIGFDDNGFILPELIENQHIIKTTYALKRGLFIRQAEGLKEQRDELRKTLTQRCEKVAELVSKRETSVVWCHLNAEGDLLEKLIPGSVQVSGSDSDEHKEKAFKSFSDGTLKILITKPKIGGFGLNWQHCNHMTFFPSHSFEQYYQSIRRCWRFGQERPVTVDIVTTKSGVSVLANLQRKAKAADDMFNQLLANINKSITVGTTRNFTNKEEVPKWL